MSHPNRSIFRRNAVEHYIQNQEKQVLPRYISPRVFAYWWLLLLLLMTAIGVMGSIQVPIYRRGQAIVTESTTTEHLPTGHLTVFLSALNAAEIKVGQTAFVTLDAAFVRLPGQVVAVERQPLSPQAAQARFSLTPLTATAVTEPVVTVLVAIHAFPAATLPTVYAGGLYPVEIAVGTQRLVMLLPWLPTLFMEAQV